MDGRITVSGRSEAQFIEKKSRFIGYIAHAETEKEAQAFLEEIRTKHRDATHNCYAWICGEHDESQRSSDAGEPAGTAGRPILEAIKRAELHDTVIVVTRYFGGILLGAGGLTRAYAKSAQIAIEAAAQVRMISGCRVLLEFDYTLQGKVETCLQKGGFAVESRTYGEKVGFFCLVEEARIPELEHLLTEACSGKLRLQQLDEAMLAQPV